MKTVEAVDLLNRLLEIVPGMCRELVEHRFEISTSAAHRLEADVPGITIKKDVSTDTFSLNVLGVLNAMRDSKEPLIAAVMQGQSGELLRFVALPLTGGYIVAPPLGGETDGEKA
jgi:hypothetical protein